MPGSHHGTSFAEDRSIWRFAMSLIRAGLRPAFALLVIAHALSHALLPLQEFLSPANLANDAMPLILIAVAMIGFTIAGVGLLGAWPFTVIVRPAIVLASAYSLVAIWRMGAGGLWWGAPVDLALFVIGLTGWYPSAISSSAWHRVSSRPDASASSSI